MEYAFMIVVDIDYGQPQPGDVQKALESYGVCSAIAEDFGEAISGRDISVKAFPIAARER